MAITASEARKNLFPLIEQVNQDRTPVEITSERGDAVLILHRRLPGARGNRLPAACTGQRPATSRTTDRATVKRINRLLDDVARDPFDGIGKPEQPRYVLAG